MDFLTSSFRGEQGRCWSQTPAALGSKCVIFGRSPTSLGLNLFICKRGKNTCLKGSKHVMMSLAQAFHWQTLPRCQQLSFYKCVSLAVTYVIGPRGNFHLEDPGTVSHIPQHRRAGWWGGGGFWLAWDLKSPPRKATLTQSRGTLFLPIGTPPRPPPLNAHPWLFIPPTLNLSPYQLTLSDTLYILFMFIGHLSPLYCKVRVGKDLICPVPWGIASSWTRARHARGSVM